MSSTPHRPKLPGTQPPEPAATPSKPVYKPPTLTNRVIMMRREATLDPSWLRTNFLTNGRETLSPILQRMLIQCGILKTESLRGNLPEDFTTQVADIQRLSEELLAHFGGRPPAPQTEVPAPKPRVIQTPTAAAPATPIPKPPARPAAAPTGQTEEEANLIRNFRSQCGTILVAASTPERRERVSSLLEQNGHAVTSVSSGPEVIELVHLTPFDLILLEIDLDAMAGLEVLQFLKGDLNWRHIPIIILSALEDRDRLTDAINLGADDFLTYPFDPLLTLARANTSIEKKRLRDQEQTYLDQLQLEQEKLRAEQEKSDRLLLNILPHSIAERLKDGEGTIADKFPDVSVLFADIVGFTELATELTPERLVHSLNEIFSSFDQLAERHGLEKIKTIGDAYMVVGGLPIPRPDHAQAIADMALDMQSAIGEFNNREDTRLQIRIGIHSGPVIAGIIGRFKFIYDLWGDAVNTASRMESHGLPDSIQVSPATYAILRDQYQFVERGSIDIKGKGDMLTFLLIGKL